VNAEQLLARLEGVKRLGDGRWKARCPSHKDRTPSLSVREFDSGKVGVHCFGGCSVEAVVAALGLGLEDLFPPRDSQAPGAGHPGEKRPFTARQVLDALAVELGVVWLILSDVAGGREIDAAVRKRAGVARERCMALIEELRLAR
jgi:hypothetical protein